MRTRLLAFSTSFTLVVSFVFAQDTAELAAFGRIWHEGIDHSELTR